MSFKNKENEEIVNEFVKMIKSMQDTKKSIKEINEYQLLKTIFCLAAVSNNPFEKKFCLIMGTTLCNYFIIKSKLRVVKSVKKRHSIGGKNSRNNSGKSDNENNNENRAAIALASAHTQVQLCGGSSGNSLVQTSHETIRAQIEELKLLTQLKQSQMMLRQMELQEQQMESDLETTIIAKRIVKDMLNSRLGAGTYLSVCGQSTTTCVACFALIQTTQQICSNGVNNIVDGISGIATAVTPEVVSKLANDASIGIQGMGTWFSSTYDYMVGTAVPNITQGVNITPEDIAQAQTIQSRINHFILSNQTLIESTLLRTDVQLSCAIGALTCCCLLSRECTQARTDRRTAALTYSGTFANAAKLEEIRSNGVAKIVNAGVSAFIPGSSMSSFSQPVQSPIEQQMDQRQMPSNPEVLLIGNRERSNVRDVRRRGTHRRRHRYENRPIRRTRSSSSSGSPSLSP